MFIKAIIIITIILVTGVLLSDALSETLSYSEVIRVLGR